MTREDFEYENFDKCYTKEFDGVAFLIGESTYDVAVVREENLKNYDDWNDFFWINGVWDDPPRSLEAYYYNNRVDYLDEDDAVETWIDFILESSSYEGLDALLGDEETYNACTRGVRECLEYLAETYVRPSIHDAFTMYATNHSSK